MIGENLLPNSPCIKAPSIQLKKKIDHVEECRCGILPSCGTGGTEKWAGSTTDDGRPSFAGDKKSGTVLPQGKNLTQGIEVVEMSCLLQY